MKRSIHTMITLIIVLVLLFVIFRLMPGDPTRFFIRPGQTAADIEDLEVEFGFKKRVPAPGNGFRVLFAASDPGVYEIALHVEDTQSRAQDFYFYHVRQTEPPPSVPGAKAEATASNGDSLWEINPGEDVLIEATVINRAALGAESFFANVTISSGGQPVTTLGPFQGLDVSATWTPSEVGVYSISAFFEGSQGTRVVGLAGVGVNVANPTPFRLVEDHLTTEPLSEELLNRAFVTINVTSAGSSIARVTTDIRSPTGETESLALFHPLIAVPQNVVEEFWTYFTAMLVGDFGRSLYTRRAVWDEISLRVGPSLILFGSAVIISYLLGILVGAVLAWRRGSKMELSAIVVSLFFYSMPVFWFGLILLWAFAFSLGWFPLGGFGGVDEEGNPLEGLAYAGSVLHHMALPLLNLVMLGLAGTILLMRNSMLEVMGEDYITTAKAKGITERKVMYRHAARNAMLPVVTAFALAISGVISGGVLTETIFSWPGMGAFLVQSTLNQDYPSVQGAFYLLALLTIFANLIADVLYAYLDPRVRL